MIRILENKDIDRVQWDKRVGLSCFPAHYGMSWFLDLVSPEWKGMVVDDYLAVLPLTVRKKYGISYLAQPPFTQQLGVFSRDPADESLIRNLIIEIKKTFSFADIQLNETNRVSEDGITVFPRRNIVLSLSRSYPDLRQMYHTQLRRNLATFGKSGLSVVQDNASFMKVIEHSKQHQTKKYGAIREKDYATLLDICQDLFKRNLLEVRYVKDRTGNMISGSLFMHMPERYVFLFSSNSGTGYATSAMSAILDTFIKEHSGEEALLDFEGSDQPGLARFYFSFGGYERTYLRIRINRLPWWIRWSK